MADGTGVGSWALKALQGSAGQGKEVWEGFHSSCAGKDECTKSMGYLDQREDGEACGGKP